MSRHASKTGRPGRFRLCMHVHRLGAHGKQDERNAQGRRAPFPVELKFRRGVHHYGRYQEYVPRIVQRVAKSPLAGMKMPAYRQP